MINTDNRTERWPQHPVIRSFDPPRAVQVDIGKALPLGRGGATRADYVSLRVKSSSIYRAGLRPALQTHWLQMHDGPWLAACTVYVTDVAGTNSLELDISSPPTPSPNHELARRDDGSVVNKTAHN